MKLKNKSHYIVIGVLSFLFTSQTHAMGAAEAAYFKRQCTKSGGHVGIRDGEYVCAGGSVMAPVGKGNMAKVKKSKQQKKTNIRKKADKEEAY